jgi:hypothetical protein
MAFGQWWYGIFFWWWSCGIWVGSDTTKILTKWTMGGILALFITAVLLSIVKISYSVHKQHKVNNIQLRSIVDEDEYKKE